MHSILIASSNSHKAAELEAMLGGLFRMRTLAEFGGAPKVVEDAPDFRGNAIKKAVTLANWLSSSGEHEIDHVLADDSGLEVDFLNGAPGVYSARFAALDSGTPGNSPDADNNAKLLRLLANVPGEKRTARFRCAIAFTPVPGEITTNASPVCEAQEAELGTEVFEGTCEGLILEQPKGESGFGYDPLFLPLGFTQSFAELGEEAKNRISHRARAMRTLKDRLSAGGF